MKLLVTLDGSAVSEAILAPAARLARSMGAEVELFAVGDPHKAHETFARQVVPESIPAAGPSGAILNVPLPSETMPRTAETREQAIERIEDELRAYLMEKVHAFEGLTTSVHVEIADHPAEAIIAHARAQGADMIAMATHGRTGIRHLLAGSVAEAVIRSGVAPVLALRPEHV
ncbi:MAG: universal stress protein [Dehalococcoidia bacterium]